MSAPLQRSDAPAPPPPPSTPEEALGAIAARIDREVLDPWAAARGRLSLALIGLALLIGSQLARLGTLRLRLAALGLAVGALVAVVIWQWVQRRRTRTMRAKLAKVAPMLGAHDVERALEAHALHVRLTTTALAEGVSPSLARVHALRSIGRLDISRLSRGGERRATQLTRAAWLVGVIACVGVILAPSRFVEGLDVAVAKRGLAPMPLTYLDDIEVTVHPPAYLHLEDRHVDGRTAL
ncbi:MAG: hypothetical protein ACHREM_24810, partial [Polyangiales bacterium]